MSQLETHFAAPTRHTMPCKVPIKTKYLLTGDDLSQCIRIGTERNSNNKKSNTMNFNNSGRDDEIVSIQGVIGEWVFCRLFGIDPTPLNNTQCRNRWNDSFDAVICGKTIDVKTPLHHSSELWVTVSRGKHAPDFYCLMTVERSKVDSDEAPYTVDEHVELVFHGFIHRDVLLVGGNIRRRGRGNVYIALQSNMKCLEDVMCIDVDDLPRLF
jgi:hypothetical protein